MSTPNMLLVLPVDHGSSDVWGPILSTLFDRVDLHNHTTGLGVKVPTAGLNIDADLSFSPIGTARALTDVKAIDFAAVASTAVTAYAGAFFLSDGTGGLTANELYYRTTGGSNVKVTSGAALNVAAFAGGIGGDYAAVGAQLNFDDAGDRYTFKQQNPFNWARMASGEVRIFETGTTESVFVGLAAPAALAAAYTITLPLAAPGSTSLVQMDSAGVLTASNTVATITPTTVAGTPNFTGAVTMASTLGVTGLVTATAGVTAAANQHLTVSGTGRLKHGSRELNLAISAYAVDGASTYATFNQAGYISTFGGACSCQAWIPLEVGKRIVSLQQFYDVAGTGLGIQFFLKRINHVTGTVTTIVSSANDSTGTGIELQTLGGINHTVLAGEAYWVQVNVTAATHRVYGCTITYDEP